MYVSLETFTRQLIPPKTWTLLRFEVENNPLAKLWHPTCDLNDPRSALVMPANLPDPSALVDKAVVALLTAMVQWEESTQQINFTASGVPDGIHVVQGQTAQQFARDPLNRTGVGPAGGLDTTGTRDKPNTPGKDYDTNAWAIIVRNGTPVGVRVYHDDPAPRAVTLAEFKVTTLTPYVPTVPAASAAGPLRGTHR